MVKLNLKVINSVPCLTADSDKGVRIKMWCEFIDIPFFIQMIREAAEYQFKFDHTFLD